jgi:hypothetical protein
MNNSGEALHAKISMAELVRRRLQPRTVKPIRNRALMDPILKVAGVCCGPVLSGDIDKELYNG